MDNWITKSKWTKTQCYDVKHYYRNVYTKKDLHGCMSVDTEINYRTSITKMDANQAHLRGV